jgi:hypothetical protein
LKNFTGVKLISLIGPLVIKGREKKRDWTLNRRRFNGMDAFDAGPS